MAREWFELTPSQILRKVYTKEFLHDLLERTFKDLPVKRGGVIGDRWQRVWATVTKTGTEIVLEIRKKDDEGWWYSIVDNNGDVFYKGKVKNESELKRDK